MPPEVPLPDDDFPSMASMMRRLAVGLVLLLAVVAVAGSTLQEPLEAISAAFIDRFGVWGLFLGVLVLDAVPFTTHEPLLFLSYNGGVSFWSVFGIAGTASMLSGALGWGVGRLLGHWSWLHRLFERYRIAPFMRRYGSRAVALAALAPFPYAITTWGAGATGVTLQQVMVGAVFRYPKVLFYLSIIVYGWSMST